MLGTSPQSLNWSGDNFGGKRIEEIALYAHAGAIELPAGPDGRQLEGSLDAQTTFTQLDSADIDVRRTGLLAQAGGR